MPVNPGPSPVQRHRIRYAKEALLIYASHLDLLRVWERALRRARVPVAYSQGFNPRPRMAFAAALPVGYSSEAELLDVFLFHAINPATLLRQLSPELPPGLRILSVKEVALASPSMQSQVMTADYEVELDTRVAPAAIRDLIDRTLAAESILRERQHKGTIRRYDLRPLIRDLWIQAARSDGITLGMRLRLTPEATGRPDEVLDLLGLGETTLSVHRTNLVCDN